MMDDQKLDELLADAAHSYRVPRTPDHDALWRGIEQQLFDSPRRLDDQITSPRRRAGWIAAVAAAAIVGIAVGRGTAPSRPAVVPVTRAASPAVASATDPYRRTTEQLLGQTEVLLAALPADGGARPADSTLVQQGVQLLTTTRRLLDSPVGSDPRMRTLLEDLELVLVQVARMHTSNHQDDLVLIHDALDERDIVPRLRSAVIDYSQRYN